MPRGKPLSLWVRGQIIRACRCGKSVRYISGQLGVPRSTVQDIITRYKQRGHINPSLRPGPQKKINVRLERRIIRFFHIIPDIPYKELKKLTGTEHLSKSTIYRLLRKHNLIKWRAKKRPLLIKEYARKRLLFARRVRRWE